MDLVGLKGAKIIKFTINTSDPQNALSQRPDRKVNKLTLFSVIEGKRLVRRISPVRKLLVTPFMLTVHKFICKLRRVSREKAEFQRHATAGKR